MNTIIQKFKSTTHSATFREVSLPLFIFGIALAIRFSFAISGPSFAGEIWSDMKIYLGISQDIEKGIWRETHFFQSIGYPLILAGVKTLSGHFGMVMIILQVVASSLTLALLYFVSYLSFGRKLALASLFLGAVHLPWIFYNNFALPEVFTTFLLSFCALFSAFIVHEKGSQILASFLWIFFFGLAFFLKGTVALWCPIFLLSLFVMDRKKFAPCIFIIAAGMSVWLAAHGTLSYVTTGKFQMSASTGGLNLVEGKCPEKKNADSNGYVWQSPLYFQLGINDFKSWGKPFTNSSYFLKEGLKCVARNPFVMVQSLESIPYLFVGNTMWPFNQKKFAAYARLHELFFAVFIMIGLAAFILDVRKRRDLRTAILWLGPVVALFTCVYIFKSEIRYRVPFDIWFIPLALYGWKSLLSHYRRNSTPERSSCSFP